MPRINVLDKKIAEMIAAGEVVERPSSIVKELVENSIDAGATSITVEIKNGGVRLIRVADNGCGVEHDDIWKVFLRHATSKVQNEDDLYKIGTLGFRGEAMASIATVSKMEMITRTAESSNGIRAYIEGGEDLETEDAGCPVGTTVIVKDLFYNIPARMKFLKRDVTEGNTISALMDRLALSHPEIAFKFIREGSVKLATVGDGKLLSAISSVHGRDFSKSMMEVKYQENGISVTGYISKPEVSKASRSMQHFFLNNRYIRFGTAMAALEEGYKNSVMVGKFPACVLHISTPLDMVDVNVHPAKMEVKLSDDRSVFTAIYRAVKQGLSTMPQQVLLEDVMGKKSNKKLSHFDLYNRPTQGEQQRMTAKEYIDYTSNKKPEDVVLRDNSAVAVYMEQLGNGHVNREKSVSREQNLEEPITFVPEGGTAFKNRGAGNVSASIVVTKQGDKTVNLFGDDEKNTAGALQNGSDESCVSEVDISKAYVTNEKADENLPEKIESPEYIHKAEQISISSMEDATVPTNNICTSENNTVNLDKNRFAENVSGTERTEISGSKVVNIFDVQPVIVGELFRTYIIVEHQNKMLMIDKHAAHERILFENLREQCKRDGIGVQQLLAPLQFSLAKEHYDIVINNLDIYQKLGLEVDDFGDGHIIVRAIPTVISIDEVEEIIVEVYQKIAVGNSAPSYEKLDDILHTIACKSAIKGGDYNTIEEQQKLFDILYENPNIRNCPHGRPVIIEMSKYQIEKMFGRQG